MATTTDKDRCVRCGLDRSVHTFVACDWCPGFLSSSGVHQVYQSEPQEEQEAEDAKEGDDAS